MFNETVITKFARAFSTNATDANFAAKIPTITQPSGSGVIVLGSPDGGVGKNNLLLMPYGTGADNDTFDMRVIGWRPTAGSGTALWIPTVLAQFACTMCTRIGVANADVVATERFCDTISLASGYGNANVDNTIVAAGAGTEVIAHVLVDAKGHPMVEICFDLGGTSTGANALHAEL